MKRNKLSHEAKYRKQVFVIGSIVILAVLAVIFAIIARFNAKEHTNEPIDTLVPTSEVLAEIEPKHTVEQAEPVDVEEVKEVKVVKPDYSYLLDAWATEEKDLLMIISEDTENDTYVMRLIGGAFIDYGSTIDIDEVKFTVTSSEVPLQVYYEYSKARDVLALNYNGSAWTLNRIDPMEVFEIAENIEYPAIWLNADTELRFIDEEIKNEVQYEELKETFEIKESDEVVLNYIEKELGYAFEKIGLSTEKDQVELIARKSTDIIHYIIVNDNSEKLEQTYQNTIEFLTKTYGMIKSEDLESNDENIKVHYIMSNYFETIVIKTDSAVVCYCKDLTEFELTKPIETMKIVLDKIEGVQ